MAPINDLVLIAVKVSPVWQMSIFQQIYFVKMTQQQYLFDVIDLKALSDCV